MTNKKSQVIEDLIAVIEANGGTYQGTEALALEVGTRKWYLIECAQTCQRNNLITIIPSNGGRGRMTTYKRNCNQPGLPRKTR